MRKQNYLLVPSRPTPNGPLHLGHIAGPYLHADVLARYLKQLGHTVKIYSGSDVYDSYVLLTAEQTQQSVLNVINTYHYRIKEDLAYLNIAMDSYINILDQPYQKLFKQIVADVLVKLKNKDVITKQTENFLYARNSNKYILGCWLLGNCPFCQHAVGGFFCENCGGHFRPEQVSNAHSRNKLDACEIKAVDCFCLKNINTNAILDLLKQQNIAKKYQDIIANYFKQGQTGFRLSHPGSWGIPWTEAGQQVVFASASIIFHLLLYSKLYIAVENDNEIEEDNLIKVALFGKDVAVPYLLGTNAFKTILDNFNGFNHFIINEFYQLEGAKFSTSRRHAIWVKDIMTKTNNINADMLRYYLCQANLTEQVADFRVAEFIEQINTGYASLIAAINYSVTQINKTTELPAYTDLLEKIHTLMQQQARYLNVTQLQLKPAIAVLNAWQAEHVQLTSASDHYWWLKGFAMLAYPFLPELAQTVWQALGHHETPCLQACFQLAPYTQQAFTIPFVPVQLTDLKNCLPASILGEVS